ncbi:MAG TPA: hypothetical protein DCP20_02850 [Coriobacteriia bacterium]|nr:hypothetical protein [Coriobacteriia bacterium]
MMEETPSTTAPNRTVMILLVVVVVLLAAIVVYLVLSGSGSTSADSGATGTAVSGEAAASMPSGMTGSAEEAEFDPATATRVAAGTTPEQHVTAYFDAVVEGDFEGAYALLPVAKQQDYGSLEAFSEQLNGYGITGFAIDSVAEEGDQSQVTATATMPGGDFQYLWTFVKDGEEWLVKSRTLPGMGN